MPVSSKQKLKLLYTMKILSELSDEDHPLSANDIITELEKYDISAERKSIYTDIQYLEEFGLNIVHATKPKYGWFLASRGFETPEVRLLMDAAQAASFITPKKTKELLGKLELQMSRNQAIDLKQQVYIENRIKSVNEEIYYNIDVIYRAITANRIVSFMYYRREFESGRTARNSGRPFRISPYAMIWVRDHYYLVGNLNWYNTLSHYRIDRMDKVELTDRPSRSFEEVCEYRNSFDAADYAARSFSMFGGETKTIVLRCENGVYEEMVDRFGEEVTAIKDDDKHFRLIAQAIISEGFISWLFQFGKRVTIIAPADVRSAVKARSLEISGEYND